MFTVSLVEIFLFWKPEPLFLKRQEDNSSRELIGLIIIRVTTVFITSYIDLCNLALWAKDHIKVFYEMIHYIMENYSLFF